MSYEWEYLTDLRSMPGDYPPGVNKYWRELAKPYDRDGDLLDKMAHFEQKKLYGKLQRTWLYGGALFVVFEIKSQRGVFDVAQKYHTESMDWMVKNGQPGPVIMLITARSPDVSFRQPKKNPKRGDKT